MHRLTCEVHNVKVSGGWRCDLPLTRADAWTDWRASPASDSISIGRTESPAAAVADAVCACVRSPPPPLAPSPFLYLPPTPLPTTPGSASACYFISSM